MRLSAIVPVRNESANIRRTLASLARQAFPSDEFEIVVVDGMSDDDTVAIVRDMQRTLPNLKLLSNPARLSSAARNIGVRHSEGEFVLIVDGHCAMHDRFHLTKVVEAFDASGADSLGRPQPLRDERPTPFQRAVAAARMSWLGHNPGSAIFTERARYLEPDNVAVAYRREVFETIGLFDESFDACEDVEFNTRVRQAGFSCFFTPTIAVDYQPRSSAGAVMYQMIRYGRGRARLAGKHPGTVTLPSVAPSLGLLALAALAIGSLFSSAALIALLAGVMCYLLVVGVESIRLARRRHTAVWRLPFVFAAIHAGFAWGYLRETLAFPFRRRIPVPVYVPAYTASQVPVRESVAA